MTEIEPLLNQMLDLLPCKPEKNRVSFVQNAKFLFIIICEQIMQDFFSGLQGY